MSFPKAVGAEPRRAARRRFNPKILPAAVLVLLMGVVPAGAWAACTRGREPAEAPLTLVLSGGGAKAAWEAGLAVALAEHGPPILLVAGASAGALNAAMIVDGRMDRLEAVWRGITRDQVYALRPSVFFAGLLPGWLTLWTLDHAGSLLDPAPLRKLLLASVDLTRIRLSHVRLLVVATDLARRGKRFFDNQTLTVDALMASAAVPGAFPAVHAGEEVLVDGGLTGRAPVLDALEGVPAGGRVVVAMSEVPSARGERPTTMRRTLERAFELAMVHQIERDVELGRLRRPDIDVELVTPALPLPLRPLDFDQPAVAQAFDRGRADGLACLETWRAR